MSNNQKQSFGEQAARYSLYAPLMALLIGLLTTTSREQTFVAIAVAGINCLLVVSGLILGIFALLSMKKHGRKGIFGRAITGVILNGIIVSVMMLVVLPLVFAARIKNQLPGQWSLQVAPNQAMDNIAVTLNKDGTFTFESSRDNSPTASLSGTWVLTRGRVLGVTIERVKQGDPSAAGTRIGLGMVKSIDDKQMVLQTDKGEERYVRLR